MTRLHRALGSLTVAWLFCQVVTVVVVPALLAVQSSSSALECTCSHDAGSTCPMHRQNRAGSALCSIRGIDDTAIPSSSFFGPIGLLTARIPATVLALTGTPAFVVHLLPAESPVPPDSPPPRV